MALLFAVYLICLLWWSWTSLHVACISWVTEGDLQWWC